MRRKPLGSVLCAGDRWRTVWGYSRNQFTTPRTAIPHESLRRVIRPRQHARTTTDSPSVNHERPPVLARPEAVQFPGENAMLENNQTYHAPPPTGYTAVHPLFDGLNWAEAACLYGWVGRELRRGGTDEAVLGRVRAFIARRWQRPTSDQQEEILGTLALLLAGRRKDALDFIQQHRRTLQTPAERTLCLPVVSWERPVSTLIERPASRRRSPRNRRVRA